MKAAICTRYGPPEVLQIEELATPEPGPGEVRIKIHATAITGSDIIVRSSKVNPAFWLPMRIVIGFRRPRNPILGFVFSGEVDALGEGAHRFELGDEVFGFTMKPDQHVGEGFYDQYIGAVQKQNIAALLGTYAEYKSLPEDSLITKKPTNISHEEAAAIPYGFGIAMHFLRKSGLNADQRLLVNGASGAIGSAAVQLAKHLDAHVTGVCSTRNLELVSSIGADAVIDYTQEDFSERDERYDVILDAVPAGMADRKGLAKRAAKVLTPGGTCLSIDDGRPEYFSEDLELFRELAESGKLEPVIDQSYSLEEIAEAHRYVETGRKRGNVMISFEL